MIRYESTENLARLAAAYRDYIEEWRTSQAGLNGEAPVDLVSFHAGRFQQDLVDDRAPEADAALRAASRESVLLLLSLYDTHVRQAVAEEDLDAILPFAAFAKQASEGEFTLDEVPFQDSDSVVDMRDYLRRRRARGH